MTCDIPADGVMTLPRTDLALPGDWPDGDYTVRLRLFCGKDLLSANKYQVRVLMRNPAL